MHYLLDLVIINQKILNNILKSILADIFTSNKRSLIMSNISGKETKQEIIVRKFLFSKGFRFRKNVKRDQLPRRDKSAERGVEPVR